MGEGEGQDECMKCYMKLLSQWQPKKGQEKDLKSLSSEELLVVACSTQDTTATILVLQEPWHCRHHRSELLITLASASNSVSGTDSNTESGGRHNSCSGVQQSGAKNAYNKWHKIVQYNNMLWCVFCLP